MFNLQEIIKCEKDIDWKNVGVLEKNQFSVSKHKMVESYEYLIKSRDSFVSDFEDCIINCKSFVNRSAFDTYANNLVKFNNAYQVYCMSVARCKGVHC